MCEIENDNLLFLPAFYAAWFNIKVPNSTEISKA